MWLLSGAIHCEQGTALLVPVSSEPDLPQRDQLILTLTWSSAGCGTMFEVLVSTLMILVPGVPDQSNSLVILILASDHEQLYARTCIFQGFHTLLFILLEWLCLWCRETNSCAVLSPVLNCISFYIGHNFNFFEIFIYNSWVHNESLGGQTTPSQGHPYCPRRQRAMLSSSLGEEVCLWTVVGQHCLRHCSSSI